MNFKAGFDSFKEKVLQNMLSIRKEHDILLTENEKKLNELQFLIDSPFCPLSLQDAVPVPTRGRQPWGFMFGYQEFKGLENNQSLKFPLVYSFLNYSATAIDDDGPCANLLLDFAMKAIVSYPLGDVNVYTIDANIGGVFSNMFFNKYNSSLDNPEGFFHNILDVTLIDKVLDKLEQLLISNIQNYASLAGSVYDFNQNSKGYVPSHFLFIKDINKALNDSQKEQLVKIIANANATKAGIYVFYTYTKDNIEVNESNRSNAMKSLLDSSFELSIPVDDSSFVVSPNITQDDIKKVYDFVANTPKIIPSFSFKDDSEAMLKEGLWKDTLCYEENKLSIPIGFNENYEKVNVNIPFNSSPHIFLTGQTGTGKSFLIYNFILNAALKYSPDQLRFYLLDMSGNFHYFNKLPHSRIVCASSDVDYAYSVLHELEAEMERRQIIYSSYGCDDIYSYNKYAESNNLTRLPYIICIIDEFQRLYAGQGKNPNKEFENIHKVSRKYGISLFLSTQSLGGVSVSSSSQVAIRLALSCNAQDSRTILGNDAAAKLLKEDRFCILNEQAGFEDFNKKFRAANLDKNDMVRYVEAMDNYYKTKTIHGEIEHTIYNDLKMEVRLDANKSFGAPSKQKKIFVGLPSYFRDEHIYVNFQRNSKSHVAICGADRESAMKIIGVMSMQFAKLYEDSKIYVMDFQNSDSETYQNLKFLDEKVNADSLEIDGSSIFISAVKDIYAMYQQRKTETDKTKKNPEVLVNIVDFFNIDSVFGRRTSLPEFEELLQDGPRHGIHIVLYSHDYANWYPDFADYFEVKIGLYGGESMRFLYRSSIRDEVVKKKGMARIIQPKGMGLTFDDGDLFLVYNQSWDDIFQLF